MCTYYHMNFDMYISNNTTQVFNTACYKAHKNMTHLLIKVTFSPKEDEVVFVLGDNRSSYIEN